MHIEVNPRFPCLLKERAQTLTESIESLASTGRKDEADLKKAARNIYGIFLTLLDKNAKMDDILRLFTTLPCSWQKSRSLAVEHSDYVRVAIEDIKLAALNDIKNLYAQTAQGAESCQRQENVR